MDETEKPPHGGPASADAPPESDAPESGAPHWNMTETAATEPENGEALGARHLREAAGQVAPRPPSPPN